MPNLNFTLIFINNKELIKLDCTKYETIYEELEYCRVDINDIEAMIIFEDGKYYPFTSTEAIYKMNNVRPLEY